GGDSPADRRMPGVRCLPRPGFASLKIGVLWQGELDGMLKTFVDGIKSHVAELRQTLAGETA
ncbi:MAG: hypothetical protein VX509_01395, partial [Verrucomicrobiota bacterium]|nr:hypothetical protein [Verrucomicrobiota bacterium]